MTDVKTLIEAATSETLGITVQYAAFGDALGSLDSALRVEQGSNKSAEVYQLDKLRDTTWSAIRGRVNATVRSPVEAEEESARKLKRVISLYGNMRKMSYNEESAALTNLVGDLQNETYSPHVDLIGITTWVAMLKEQNEHFQTVLNQRNTELAGRLNADVRSTRLIIDPIYKQMVKRINATITLDMAAEGVETFVNELNEKIKYYQTQLAIRAGRNSKEEAVDEEV
jgi:hypothetical protein